MLALLLQTVENALGPSLGLAAVIVFWSGIAVAAYMVAAPMARIAIDIGTARAGFSLQWITQCPACKHDTEIVDARCTHCRVRLSIPWHMHLRRFFGPRVGFRWWHGVSWAWSIVGIAAFTIMTVGALTMSGAWNPQTNVEMLLVGLALIAWAGLAGLVAGVLNLGAVGPFARLRDAIYALASAAVLSALMVLASAARPVPETLLARIIVQGQVAQVSGRTIAPAGGQLGFEYLQINHALLGYQKVFPLAIVGMSSIPLAQDRWTGWMVDHLWQYARGYTARGLAVRKRSEQILINEQGTYDVILHGQEIKISHRP